MYETVQNRVKKWFSLALLLLVVGLAGSNLYELHSDSAIDGSTVPYLQMVGEGRATIRWLSSEPYLGAIQYGEGSVTTNEVVEKGLRKRHRVTLTGLKSDTRYSYRLGGDGGEEVTRYSFVTAPAVGSERPLRLWIQGDPGYYRDETGQVVSQAMRWMESNARSSLPLFDLWITTGDNAYPSGSRDDYLRELYNAYPDLLPYYPYLPVYGNHDARNKQFFKLFSLPKEGELGGVVSGTEHYFSLDYGQMHLIFLDSTTHKLITDGTMAQWLRRDLQANRQRWTLALFHHPPYTKGTHDSDSEHDSQGRMRKVREQIVPILEEGGVDTVISGHSHVYERSYQMKGHYGSSDTLKPEMIIDRDNCSEKGVGTYYLVVGASAKQGGGALDHPAMALSTAAMGSLVIDISHDEFRASYVDKVGELLDQFSIRMPIDGSIDCAVGRGD